MSTSSKDILSAQVILRSATGRAPATPQPLTTQNLQGALPEPGAAAEARRQFAALGFDVGPWVGTSFSLSAPRECFEQVFHARLTEDLRELPLSGLPPALRQFVASVVLPPPPDFGPASFGS